MNIFPLPWSFMVPNGIYYIGTRHEKLDDFANLKLTHPESIPGNMVHGNLSHITFARACQICSETFKNKGVEVL